MKQIKSYFKDNESAICAAYDLSENSSFSRKIHIGYEKPDHSGIFDSCFFATLAGSAIGVLFGFIIGIFFSPGQTSYFFPFSGFLTGGVIGSLTGCLIDFFISNNSPYYFTVSFFTDSNHCASIIKSLRKKGACGNIISRQKKSKTQK